MPRLAQPARSSTPPTGVTAPSHRSPVSASTYNDPENTTIPAANDPIARVRAVFRRLPTPATASIATAWIRWYRDPVSYTANNSAEIRSRTACAPNAPIATAVNPAIEARMKAVREDIIRYPARRRAARSKGTLASLSASRLHFQPRTIAVPVLAGMGNGLMTQPLVRQLAAAWPDARVTVFARNRSISAVFDRLAEVDKVCVFGNEPWQFARLLRELRAMRPDLLIIPYPSNRWQYSLLARASRAGRIVMHRYPVGRLRAMRDLVANRVPTVESRHDVLANLDLLARLDITADESMSPQFPLKTYELEAGRDRLAAAASGERYCAIHAGSGDTIFALSKRWPPERWSELIPRLRSDFGLTPVLLEGPEDAGVIDLIRQHVDVPALQLTGPLAEAAAVLKACTLYVGSDSGLAHLAAAVGTPPVTLFGPARPDEVSPFGYRHLVVQTPARCAPCFRYPQFATTPAVQCRPPYCIGQITPDAVVAAVGRALARDLPPCHEL